MHATRQTGNCLTEPIFRLEEENKIKQSWSDERILKYNQKGVVSTNKNSNPPKSLKGWY